MSIQRCDSVLRLKSFVSCRAVGSHVLDFQVIQPPLECGDSEVASDYLSLFYE